MRWKIVQFRSAIKETLETYSNIIDKNLSSVNISLIVEKANGKSTINIFSKMFYAKLRKNCDFSKENKKLRSICIRFGYIRFNGELYLIYE